MPFLAGLSWRRRALAVSGALDAAGARGADAVHVLGSPRLAGALARRGRPAHELSAAELAAAGDDSLAALVAVGDRPADYAAWRRALCAGAALVLVARVSPIELSRRALCAGLVDLEERRAGGTLVMSGRVWKPRRGTAT